MTNEVTLSKVLYIVAVYSRFSKILYAGGGHGAHRFRAGCAGAAGYA
jgi:hypothetical protein